MGSDTGLGLRLGAYIRLIKVAILWRLSYYAQKVSLYAQRNLDNL